MDAEVQTQSAPESRLKESRAGESRRKDSPKKKGASQGKTISLRGTPKKKSPTLGQLASYQSQYRSPLKRLDPHDIDIKCIKARIAKLQDRQGTQRTPSPSTSSSRGRTANLFTIFPKLSQMKLTSTSISHLRKRHSLPSQNANLTSSSLLFPSERNAGRNL